MTTPPETVERILALSAENPAWGCGRIASQLRLEGIQLSSPTVQGLLIKHGLGTRHERLLKLEERMAIKPITLTAEQIRLTEKTSPSCKESRVDIRRPGSYSSISSDDTKISPADQLNSVEKRMRLYFEKFLDLRRRTLAPEPGDPPDHPFRLTSAALLVLKQLIEQGADWAFAIHHQQLQAKAAGQRDTTPEEVLERLFLASVISTGGVVPPQSQERLANGLRALNQGETQPLLQATPSGRWRDPYSLAQLRLYALLHVHFHWGRGLKKAAAVADVAAALATSTANVRKWEQSWVPEMMGNIRNMLAMAERAGDLARRYPEGIPDEHERDRWFAHHLEQERTLTRIAEEHKRLMHSSVQTGGKGEVIQTGPR
jgi:hypothetical protein